MKSKLSFFIVTLAKRNEAELVPGEGLVPEADPVRLDCVTSVIVEEVQ